LEIRDSNNNIMGTDANIQGFPAYGINQAKTMTLKNSSLGYHNNDKITLQSNTKFITGVLIIGAIGKLEGYYSDNNSFASDQKYLIDSNYYQEYSYDIRTDEIFSEYFDVLKKTVHPTGKKAFGSPRLTTEINNTLTIVNSITTN